VYCTLTNNTQRGTAGHAAPDSSNPRTRNVYGHIIQWREAGSDAGASHFSWNVFALAGDAQAASAEDRPRTLQRSIDASFGSPDGLVFDRRGLLWIQTDVFVADLGKGAYARLGNNQMLCMDTQSGETRRFLVGPNGSEVTGLAFSPDMRSMFVNIQHPGETPTLRSDPTAPAKVSSWPTADGKSAPRSATVLVRRRDGGVIGT
jgi:secreted PhoX family phosphatase